MTTSSTSTCLASHVSIDTGNLARSQAFYSALLDSEPVLVKPDYVRFWPAELGLVLALNARRHEAQTGSQDTELAQGNGALQHLGLLFPDAASLRAARLRLDAAGFASTGAEHVACCYAELDQFWVSDPSGVRWELFLAHDDGTEDGGDSSVESGARSTEPSTCCTPSCCT